MKTAIIHEWLVNYAGSERVLEQIVKLFPDADLFRWTSCLIMKEDSSSIKKQKRR